ncbi:MBL fold metallo-hydrolase [Candidatus Atribacteria bacterium HGW-Atribacteria-1]|nr:MAG: MBL fold metallo-hydrolase [Candidatus Atribacteria bacterium HGW-Atribacteria-1]
MALNIQKIASNTYLIPSTANIGVYVQDEQVILIDSGNDKEAGRQILKLLNEKNWKVKFIINTHSNADHIGGNAFIQNKTDYRIAATRIEAAFIQDPILEPSFLYGGFPNTRLTNKFLMAQSSRVTDIIPSSGKILDTNLEAISLPGHFFDMIGIKTPDNIMFIADSLFSEEIINKYHLFFLYDIKAHLETLEKLKTIEAEIFIPSHGSPTPSIKKLIAINESKVREIISTVLLFCERPATFDEILSRICKRYKIDLNANQYVLVSNTIKSYLSFLYDEGKLGMSFSEGNIFWKKKDFEV